MKPVLCLHGGGVQKSGYEQREVRMKLLDVKLPVNSDQNTRNEWHLTSQTSNDASGDMEPLAGAINI